MVALSGDFNEEELEPYLPVTFVSNLASVLFKTVVFHSTKYTTRDP